MAIYKAGNLVLALGLVLLGFSILGVSVFGQVTPGESGRTLVEEEMIIESEKVQPVNDAVVPTPTSRPKVDYQIVYPGILPDHFLYPLKMIRDRVWLFLTTGPKRKAVVMLLFADKRLGAGQVLIEGGKEKLGVTTLTKGEKYLENAVAQLRQAKDKGEDIGELNKKFANAVAKHQEVLQELKEKVSTEEWGVIDQMLEKTKMMREEIEGLRK